MKQVLSFIAAFMLISLSINAQENVAQKAKNYGFLQEPTNVPSIASQMANGTFVGVDPNEGPKLGQPKKKGVNNVIPGKGLPVTDDALVASQKSAVRKSGKEPLLVFEANTANATPSDPTGAVGPNHYIGSWNSGFRIFDKAGNPLTPEASLGTIFPGNTLGDPIILYDVEADRFIITEFDNSPNGFNVAICQGPDPVNDGWYVYTSGFNTGSFPDYTKFSIWSDGYYVTANISASNRMFVVEREEMLQGNPSQFVALPLPGITTSGFYSPQFFNVTNGDLPPTGGATVVYLQDDAWGGVSEDHLKLWTVDVDWETPSNSEISAAVQIPTTPFISVFDGGSFSNRPQPAGPNIDVLQATVMNQAQYRRFPGYNSALFNFVVDTDASGGELAGIRWYELRQTDDGEPWEIYQEGTYISPNNNKDAFSGSMAMDGNGNIGMGYTTVSSSEKIAIYYTGRYASDPLGQMTINEELIAQSNTNNPSNRLADYVHLTLDPANDKTFWHIAEYFNSNARTDVVGVFQIAPDYLDDLGIASIDAPESGALSDATEITVTVFNGGENEQADFDLYYQVDGGDIVTETFSGTLGSQEFVQYTFAQTADLSMIGNTYEILAYTALEGDEDPNNDAKTKLVKYIGPYDLGVATISSPTTAADLSDAEEITVLIENYGTEDQSDFDVSYVLGDETVTELVDGPLAFGAQLSYTFDAQGDFSESGLHYVMAYSSADGDSDLMNDTAFRAVLNSDCIPAASCANGHEIKQVQLGTMNNETGCSENGYGDYVTMSTDLDVNSLNELTLSASYGNQFVKVWIDFNDDFVFDTDEVVSSFEMADGQSGGSYTQVEDLVIPENAHLGEHLMRVKLSWIIPIGDDEACADISQGGETEDYMVNIVQPVGFGEAPLQDAEMIIADLGNNQFRVTMKTNEWEKPLRLDVHNTMGQCVIYNRVQKSNGIYTYDIDMSYAQKGIYIIRFGSDDYGKVRKFVVK